MRNSRLLLSEDIQTIEQLTQYVFLNPSCSDGIVKIYQESGYLDMWKHEANQNPWRYDGVTFMSLPVDDIEKRDMAVFEKESASEQIKLFASNYTEFLAKDRQFSTSYTKMNIQLYLALINQMEKRLKAANFVLQAI